jgi:diadenosine tetraphosphate (Ap4A) HIT family hydrolase
MSVLGEESPFSPVDPARVILETDAAVAFHDGFPVSEGHALVVPRFPVISLFELDPDMQAAVWESVRLTREILEERYHPDGFNIGINDGQAAGQTIPHAHIHIIPRYKGDVPDPRGGIRLIIPEKAKYWQGAKQAVENQKVTKE